MTQLQNYNQTHTNLIEWIGEDLWIEQNKHFQLYCISCGTGCLYQIKTLADRLAGAHMKLYLWHNECKGLNLKETHHVRSRIAWQGEESIQIQRTYRMKIGSKERWMRGNNNRGCNLLWTCLAVCYLININYFSSWQELQLGSRKPKRGYHVLFELVLCLLPMPSCHCCRTSASMD